MALIVGVVGAVTTALFIAVVWSFRVSFREMNRPTWWFALAFLLIAVSIIVRTVYWDITIPMLRAYNPEAAVDWVRATGGRFVNLVFALFQLAACYCALKCRQMLIPEDERHLWPWWKAWMHPNSIRLLYWR